MSGCDACGAPVADRYDALCPACEGAHDQQVEARIAALNAWTQAQHAAVQRTGVRIVAHVRCAACGGRPLGQVVLIDECLYLRRPGELLQYLMPGGWQPGRPSQARAAGRGRYLLGWAIQPGRTHGDLFPWDTPYPDQLPHVVCRVHGRIDWTPENTTTLRLQSVDSAARTVSVEPTT